MRNKNISYSFDSIQYHHFIDQKIELYGTLTTEEDADFEVYVNHVYVGYTIQKTEKIDEDHTISFHMMIPLSSDPHHLLIVVKNKSAMSKILEMEQKDIDQVTIEEGVYANVDKYVINDDMAKVTGYAYSTRERTPLVQVTDSDGLAVSADITWTPRTDLVSNHTVSATMPNCGFQLSFLAQKNKKYNIMFTDHSYHTTLTIKRTTNKANPINVFTPQSINRVYKYIRTHGISKSLVYVKAKGIHRTIKKVFERSR